MPTQTSKISLSWGGGARPLLASAVTIAIVGTGLALASSPAIANSASIPTCANPNPMGAATPNGSKDGYTVFVTENAILANSELEGTLAVGGTATFGDPRGKNQGQYPIMHGNVGGNADYSVPTISGEPNRVLIQRFASDSLNVQVKDSGATGTNAQAGVKIGDHTTPANYIFGKMFGGEGTTYYPNGGGNTHPQIDSIAQKWVDAEQAKQSWSIDGDVLSQFPDDNGASLLSFFTGWKPIDVPTANDQTIALSPDGPSRLTLSDFGTFEKFKLSGYSESSFLVITVAPSDVVDGRVTLPSYSHHGKDGDEKEGISHILFDFSSINGTVEITSRNEPVRGAIYAPNAHIVFPDESNGGREFEGQIIARNFTALSSGKELHTNLFKGRFDSRLVCTNEEVEPELGGFDLSKALKGINAKNLPKNTVFTVTAHWAHDGVGVSSTFELPADGSLVTGPRNLAEGTKVTFEEVKVPEIDGYTFKGVEFSASTITVKSGVVAQVVATNTYAAEELAETGAAGVTKAALGGVLLLVAGVAVLLIRRLKTIS